MSHLESFIEGFNIGAWLSLVERTVRDREVGGSNPLAPTNKINGCGDLNESPLRLGGENNSLAIVP